MATKTIRKEQKADKLILFQSEAASEKDRYSIPYAIDRQKNDLTLQDITRSALNFLSKDMSKDFPDGRRWKDWLGLPQ